MRLFDSTLIDTCLFPAPSHTTPWRGVGRQITCRLATNLSVACRLATKLSAGGMLKV